MQPDFRRPIYATNVSAYPPIPTDGLVSPHPGPELLLTQHGFNPDNPLGTWIKPGMRVLVKPNWVRHATEGWSVLEALTTHPSIVRSAVEMVARALRDDRGDYCGEICLADAPLQSANFSALMQQSGIGSLVTHWKATGLPISLADLRKTVAEVDDGTGVVAKSYQQLGDPRGHTVVDLKKQSRLESLVENETRLGVSNYDSARTTQHHLAGKHEYCVANSLLEADVVVNLPKWKTHVKTGVTGALKNFIGINCDKEFLPHFRVGPPNTGGDEYPDSVTGALLTRMRPLLEKVMPHGLLRQARRAAFSAAQNGRSTLIFGGAWPGNDTLWRTVHDMVFVARWLGPHGAKLSSPRPILTLLDAIVAGEGDGPLRPEPRLMNTLVFGTDPGQIDLCAAALSDFDWRLIPLLAHLGDSEASSITDFDVATWDAPRPLLTLKAPSAWSSLFARGSVSLAKTEVSHEAA